MSKINVMYELEQNSIDNEFLDDKINVKYNKEKNIKISNKIFNIMLDEGLLQKTNDGYVFIGKYSDLLSKKKPRFNR